LAQHLRHERSNLFTFLYCPGLGATNNVAERVMRILGLEFKIFCKVFSFSVSLKRQ